MPGIEEKNFNGLEGVPDFSAFAFEDKKHPYCVLIPIINEGQRIQTELTRIQKAGIPSQVDVILCDGGSTDGSTEIPAMISFGVNTLLVKKGPGKQGAQFRMGFFWALQRGYQGFVTVDGNNKDSVEDIPHFTEKLNAGLDFIQGSRYLPGGEAVNTPLSRHLAARLIHAPIISLTAGKHYTDTTNAFRAYSRNYISDPRVQIFRDVFSSYELLAYLSVRADQLHLKSCEIPVTRVYPKNEKTPTKISPFKGNWQLLKILFANLCGKFNP